MSEFPSGPIPEDLRKSVLDIMLDVGVSTLTKKILRKRLEAKYKIEFDSHIEEVDKAVSGLMLTPEIQRELAKAQQDREERPAGGKGKKRSRSGADSSKSKGSKKDKKDKGEKEKKPDDYPKAALSAYFLFANDNRDRVKAADPSLKITEVTQKIGELWKTASTEAKERYQKKADEEKARFDREMKAYIARGGTVIKRSGKGGKEKRVKKEKDPNAPKRASSSYLFFANDFRTKNPQLSAKEQMSSAGAAWGKMSEADKKPYEELAAKDKRRYAQEIAAYGSKSSSAKNKRDAASSSSSSSGSDDSSDSDSDSE